MPIFPTGYTEKTTPTTNDKILISDVSASNQTKYTDFGKLPVSTATQTALNTKVDKETGKGLSTNDYTTTEKNKLAGIEALAEVNNISDTNATDLTDGGNTTLHIHDSRYYTETETDVLLNTKQDTLIAGTNITIVGDTISSTGGGGGSGNAGAFAYELQTATASQTVFNLGFTYVLGNNLQVFLNGQKLIYTEDYNETDTDTITFISGVTVGEKVEFVYPNKGLNWKGAYNGATAYVVDDAVSYNGSSYICILASTGNLPTNTTYFDILASKGDTGASGTIDGTTITTLSGVLKGNGSVVSGSATTADLPDSTNKRYLTDTQLTVVGNTSNTNSGDETITTIKDKLGITTLSGSNTGDQINITGNAATVTTNANLTGAITSVGNTTTMNSALNDLTDVTVPTPTTGDALRWSGTAWIGSAATSAVGSANRFYLDTTTSLADNFTLSTTPSIYAETINTKAVTNATSPVFFERFVSGMIARTSIPAGPWIFNIYAAPSSVTGNNVINFRVNKRVVQSGMTGTFTGAGATRTFTVTGGAPFVAGDANASRLLASLIETPTQTAWISGFTSSSVVTVTLTDPGFVNVAGVALNAIYYYLFNGVTPDMTSTSPTLYTVNTIQPAFSVGITDRLLVAFFATADGNRNSSLYYGGNTNFTNFISPLTTLHNDLAGLNDGDYKHLTATEYTTFTTDLVHKTGAETITGKKTFTGNAKIGDGTATNQYLEFQTNNTTEAGIQYYLADGTSLRGYMKWDTNEDLLIRGDRVAFTTQSTGGFPEMFVLKEDGNINTTGNLGVGVASPLAVLHLKAGTATANTAPLQFTAGTLETTPRAGIVEFDGTNYFATIGSTRSKIATYITTAVITATSAQTVFTVPTYIAGRIQIFVNGLLQTVTTDYTETNPTTITMGVGLTTGDEFKYIIL